MASSSDRVNRLRPYYVKPSIGSSTIADPGPPLGRTPSAPKTNSAEFASKARDIFPDIDYKEYISEPSPSVVRNARQLLDELAWQYTSILMSQPFEVAKTILQVRAQDDLGAAPPQSKAPVPPRRRNGLQKFSDQDSDQDDDEPAYFVSSTPSTPAHQNGRRPDDDFFAYNQSLGSDRVQVKKTTPAVQVLPHQIDVRRPDSIIDVVAQLWTKEGAWGVWKGSNATFVYNVLQSLLENWLRSMLSAVFSVPDLGVRDDLDRLVDIASPYPWASLFVAAGAAVATGLVLSPLDLVRTRLVVTSSQRQPRRTFGLLRALPSYFCPMALLVPTILHSLVHPLITLSTPLVLRSQFMIDRDVSPTTFSIARFCSSSVALFIKLPVETVLRRGQVAVLASERYAEAAHKTGEILTIVPLGKYSGFFGTMSTIVSEEGSRPNKAKAAPKGKPTAHGVVESVYRRGQGMAGLWRGWKVGWWGLVGLWTITVASGGPAQKEF